MGVVAKCLFLSLVSILAACGGGSGSSDTDSTSGTGSSTEGDLNPSFEGHFLVYDDDDGPLYLMDIASAKASVLPGTDWWAQDEEFPSGLANFGVVPSRDGQMWTLRVRNCISFATSDNSCIRIQDKFGNYLHSFDLSGYVWGAALSPDGNHIVVERDPIGRTTRWLQVFDLDGNLISERLVENIDPAQWLNDNSLVYLDWVANNRQFVFTPPISQDFLSGSLTSLELPAQIEGRIGSFAVSPDSRFIAFTMATDSSPINTSLWVLEIETAALHQLAHAGDILAIMHTPRWSPSGDYISIIAGGFTGGSSDNPGLPDSMYVLSSGDVMNQNHILVRNEEDLPHGVTKLKRFRDLDGSGYETTSFSDFYQYYWVE